MKDFPVIVGVGEMIDRPAQPEEGLDPLALMAAAARKAEDDAGARLLAATDSVDVIHLVSWRYRDTARRLCERLEIAPTRAVYSQPGGEAPMIALEGAAHRIATGESEVALICGGEALYTAQKARRAGIDLPWPAREKVAENPWRVDGMLHPVAIAYGMTEPAYFYPLLENAAQFAWGQTPLEGRAETAALYAGFSEVASRNPFAWSRRAHDETEIAQPSPANRPIAWPYSKLMVANPQVNQASAIFVTGYRRARTMGIPEERIVHIWGGASATEDRDYLKRDSYAHSPAQAAALHAAAEIAGTPLAHVELYSCFPVSPKMGRRTLNLADDVVPTVAGGLSYFGGPMSNYMSHAACAMVGRLRSGQGQQGLLYGLGEFFTKHHTLVLSSNGPNDRLSTDYDVQPQADALRGPVPPITADARGDATLETHTLLYDRDGSVTHGIVIVRLPDGARAMARVPGTATDILEILSNPTRNPIGMPGTLRPGAGDLTEWHL